MGLLDSVKRAVGVRDKQTVTRVQQMNAVPVRNPAIEWEQGEGANEGLALLRIPRRTGRFSNFVAKTMRLPQYRKLELDEIGTDVWTLCDGDHSIEQVTTQIIVKYKLNRRQAEASVLAYLRMLAERRLVALRTGGETNESVKTQNPRQGGNRRQSGAGKQRKRT